MILDNIATGVSRAEIPASYPAVESDDTDAAFAFTAELVREESVDLPAGPNVEDR